MAGELIVKNGLRVSGSTIISGSVTATSFTGSYSGSISNATSASYAATASVLLGSVVSASYALSASFAPDTTFPYSGSARITGSVFVTGSITSSLGYTGSFTGSLLGTGSWAVSSSYSLTATSASFTSTASYWSGSITNAVSASFALSSSRAVTSSYALTSSYLNTLNQNVLITGSLSVGLTSLGVTENTLAVGPAPGGGTGEGGQILLAASGGIYTSASMLDTYQNQFRILRGTNAGSDAFKFKVDLNSGQIQIPNYNSSTAFTGASVSTLSVDNSGNVLTTQGYTGIVTINSMPPVNFDIQNGLIINVF